MFNIYYKYWYRVYIWWQCQSGHEIHLHRKGWKSMKLYSFVCWGISDVRDSFQRCVDIACVPSSNQTYTPNSHCSIRRQIGTQPHLQNKTISISPTDLYVSSVPHDIMKLSSDRALIYFRWNKTKKSRNMYLSKEKQHINRQSSLLLLCMYFIFVSYFISVSSWYLRCWIISVTRIVDRLVLFFTFISFVHARKRFVLLYKVLIIDEFFWTTQEWFIYVIIDFMIRIDTSNRMK